MNCNLDIAKIEFSYCINVNVGEIFVLLSNNIVMLKCLIMLIFLVNYNFLTVCSCFFFKKHISLIVFFVILHPKIITPKNENKNDVKTELNYRMANVKLGGIY